MNTLLYNSRAALRDLMDINIFTRESDRVYLSISADAPQGSQDQADRKHTENVAKTCLDRLQDMDMTLAGDDAIKALVQAEAVEIVHRSA